MNVTMMGVDLAKAVFQLHGASMTSQLEFRVKAAVLDGRLMFTRTKRAA